MRILTETLRSAARRTDVYACAAVLGFRPNCIIVSDPFVGCKLNQKVGA